MVVDYDLITHTQKNIFAGVVSEAVGDYIIELHSSLGCFLPMVRTSHRKLGSILSHLLEAAVSSKSSAGKGSFALSIYFFVAPAYGLDTTVSMRRFVDT
jgi:hypothetical protein